MTSEDCREMLVKSLEASQKLYASVDMTAQFSANLIMSGSIMYGLTRVAEAIEANTVELRRARVQASRRRL